MAVQTTSNLTNSIHARYEEGYYSTVYRKRLYDQLAIDYTAFDNNELDQAAMMRGSSVVKTAISDMLPGVTAISETSDVTPQTVTDTTVSVTTTSRGEALLWSQLLTIQAYDDYTAKAYEKVAENAVESIEILAIDVATQGTWVQRAAERASLDAGTAGNRASDSLFGEYQSRLQALRVPGMMGENGEEWLCIMPPEAFHDIRESGNVDSIGLYQNAGIHLNFELGKIGPFRLVVSPWAKTFYSAGAANTTDTATTLGSAATALATTITTADDVSANIAAGDLWTLGDLETGSTNYPQNERFKVLSASTTTLTIAGEGPNGGLRFAHAAGKTVDASDHVYTLVFGGPQSLVTVFAPETGRYGQVLPPDVSGLLKQFNYIGWKYYGGYARPIEKMILRHECTSSFDA